MLSDEGREKIQNWGRRGRSFSIFQCSEDDAAQITEILGEVIPDLTTVRPSDLPDLPELSGPVLLYHIASEGGRGGKVVPLEVLRAEEGVW